MLDFFKYFHTMRCLHDYLPKVSKPMLNIRIAGQYFMLFAVMPYTMTEQGTYISSH